MGDFQYLKNRTNWEISLRMLPEGPLKRLSTSSLPICDQAATLLQLKSQMELGRATKEAALALKSRILLFAASDLTADGTATSELIGYANPNRNRIMDYCKKCSKSCYGFGNLPS